MFESLSIKSILAYILTPFAIVGWYLIKKHVEKDDLMHDKQQELTADVRVLSERMDGFEDSLKEIKDLLKMFDKKLDSLLASKHARRP